MALDHPFRFAGRFVVAALLFVFMGAFPPSASAAALPPELTLQPVLAAVPPVPPVPAVPAVPAVPPRAPDDDFAPGLMAFALLMLLVFLAIAAAAGLAFVILGAGVLILVLAGILSMSVLYGFLRRSAAEGTRALIIQLMALCGIPAGMVLAFIIVHIAGWTVPLLLIAIIGLVMGSAAGGAIGYLLTVALAALYRAVAHRRKPSEPMAGHFPVE